MEDEPLNYASSPRPVMNAWAFVAVWVGFGLIVLLLAGVMVLALIDWD